MKKKALRIGVLTGGGDCPGLNAAIRAVSKSLMINCSAEIIGIHDGFLGLIEQRTKKLNYADCSGILSQGGTILGTNNSASPFNFKGKDVSTEVMDYYLSLGLDGLVVIGGDGTLSIAYEMSKLGMNIVGIPKTIDNDLMGTDRTFGFDTAIGIVTEALDRLRTTGQSHKRVMILETMGRYAGWIALHAGIAGGADVIIIPEFAYDIDEVAKACQSRMGEQHYSIVVVAEGAKQAGGTLTVRETNEFGSDPIRLGGVANVLKMQLEQKIDAEIRATTLGHIQRGGSPSAYDRIFATNLGCYAASLVANQHFGTVVVLKNNQLCSTSLKNVADKSRLVTTESPALASALSMGICFGNADLIPELHSLKHEIPGSVGNHWPRTKA
ncbi:6-phosphofructokinase [Paraglaciecola sp. MB-3u-78]|jgi:phosphofructokinase-like protein|uniref:6-phosphofructokinase n=1 Tax=Paraglaciecola sp. MB-3u-78 TaxID=2058332 RepID=UPI000C31CC04|nr:ATP-dependent 6-phosphofructokinase [Paraglaciecola sp. MB-3u-78]PKG99571.1 6-phosphofructokinase [Paraglaciecola sp. MB-3u-78]